MSTATSSTSSHYFSSSSTSSLLSTSPSELIQATFAADPPAGPKIDNNQAGRSTMIAIIAGATAGGVALLAAAVLGYITWLRRQRERKMAGKKQQLQNPGPNDLQTSMTFQSAQQNKTELDTMLAYTILSSLGREYTERIAQSTFTFSSRVSDTNEQRDF